MSAPSFDHATLETQCQQEWEKLGIFHVPVKKFNDSKPRFYVLEMFPYPSGDIHVGHVRNYVMGDILARTKRAQGFHVLHPMGWDGFGLPAENAAIERHVHPKDWTYKNINTMRKQLKTLGLAIDWAREITTCDPEYYKHEQKMFIDFFHKDLVYQSETYVNWDPVEQTVLANEQVVNGKGWRSNAPVERRLLPQWSLRITLMAEDLLQALDTLDKWPSEVRTMQKNWIGKSLGAEVSFSIKEHKNTSFNVYTTRPDTLFGASFCALAVDHPLVTQAAQSLPQLQEFISTCQNEKLSEAALENKKKEGFLLPFHAVHPLDDSISLPVYASNFVLMEYGTGAIFGCPAHDQRDFDFAKTYNLPITQVVAPTSSQNKELPPLSQAFTEDGILINSHFLNGMDTTSAKKHIIEHLEHTGKGKPTVNYRIHDWGVSRQRYWGCPIPFIHCSSCGAVPVPVQDLPVTLPYDVDFSLGGNPLDNHPSWKHVSCPTCKKPALRETDTLDTFFESSWYFARFCDPHNPDVAFDKDIAQQWLPVHQYIGGIEHAVMHLLYSRFFSRALSLCGYLDEIHEPFSSLFNQGMVCHETYAFPTEKGKTNQWLAPHETSLNKNGIRVHTQSSTPVVVGRSEKMSKSKRNTIDPVAMIETYGADTVRLFVVSDSPLDRTIEWTESGIGGARRFIDRLWRTGCLLSPDEHNTTHSALIPTPPQNLNPQARDVWKQLHATVKHVSQDLQTFGTNRAIAHVRALCNAIDSLKEQHHDTDSLWVFEQSFRIVLRLIAPIIPHVTHALWKKISPNETLSLLPWPQYDPLWTTQEQLTIPIQINGKIRDKINVPADASRETIEKIALAQPKIIQHLKNQQVRKTIVVASRIINIVASPST
jgi:leucyl-tRNA synthetase